MTTKEGSELQEHALTRLREALDRDTSTVYTLTDHGRGETDYVRVFAVVAGRIAELTYYVAVAAGRRNDRRGIAYGGCQYSKGLEAADDCWRAAFGESIPQSRGWDNPSGWEEL